MNNDDKKITKEVLSKAIQLIMDYIGDEFKTDVLSQIPSNAPNPQPIKFGGMIPNITYDGTEEKTVVFPQVDITNTPVLDFPIGAVFYCFDGNIDISFPGCLKLDGSVYNIDEYPELAKLFADTYEDGASHYGGDGVTTFGVPNSGGSGGYSYIKAKPSYHIAISNINYSLDEHVVGTWINDKPLYEKTLNISFRDDNNEFTSVGNNIMSYSHGITDIDDAIIVDSFLLVDDMSDINSQCNIDLSSNSESIGVNKENILWTLIDGVSFPSGRVIIRIRYTKTTDNVQ